MARPKSDAPSASWSNAWKQYVIRLSGEDIPLGPDEVRAKGANRMRALCEWYERGQQPRHRVAARVTVDELILARMEHIEAAYRNSDRDPRHELIAMRRAFRPLHLAHGAEPASDFTVDKLDRLRDVLCRRTVKRRGRTVNVTKTWVDKCVSYIRRLFKWATRKRVIGAAVYAELSTLAPLRGNETTARINRPVEPVAEDVVVATLKFLPPTVRAMVELQYCTGMRSAEICQMTPAMIDTTANPWRYVPARRKTDRHNWNPPVFLSLQCQAILIPFLESRSANEPLFSPQQAPAERNAATDGTFDRVEMKYDRLGATVERKDQNGTTHAYDYDGRGRLAQDRVTAFGSSIDQTVKRIARTYTGKGQLEKVTSYDNATASSGTILNEVQLAYNDFEQLTHDYQGVDAAVNTSTTPKTQYAYADGSSGSNQVRLTSVAYPLGSTTIAYDYGTSAGVNDVLSRVESIKDGSDVLQSATYLGSASIVKIYSPGPGLALD